MARQGLLAGRDKNSEIRVRKTPSPNSVGALFWGLFWDLFWDLESCSELLPHAVVGVSLEAPRPEVPKRGPRSPTRLGASTPLTTDSGKDEGSTVEGT